MTRRSLSIALLVSVFLIHASGFAAAPVAPGAKILISIPSVWTNVRKVDPSTGEEFVEATPTRPAKLLLIDLKSGARRTINQTFQPVDRAPHFVFFDAAGSLFYGLSGPANPALLNLYKVPAGTLSPDPNPVQLDSRNEDQFRQGDAVAAYDAVSNQLAVAIPPVWTNVRKVDPSTGGEFIEPTPTRPAKLLLIDLKSGARSTINQTFQPIDRAPHFILFDAAGNLFYALSGPANPALLNLYKVPAGTLNPGPNPVQLDTRNEDQFRQGDAVAAYDAVSNQLAIAIPPVWTNVRKVDPSTGGEFIESTPTRPAKLLLIDLKSGARSTIDQTFQPVDRTPHFVFFDAAGNLFYGLSAPNNPALLNLYKVPSGTLSPDPNPVQLDSRNEDQFRQGDAVAAYDPGQRIFLDWETQPAIGVRQELNKYKVAVTILCDYSKPTAAWSQCHEEPIAPREPKLSLSTFARPSRERVTNGVRELYRKSGFAIPVLSSDSFPDLYDSGASPTGRLKLRDAVRVRFGGRIPKIERCDFKKLTNETFWSLKGKAYQGVNICNTRRDDDVAVFVEDRELKLIDIVDKLTWRVAHEAGHALGLVHVLKDRLGNVEANDVMDYIDAGLQNEQFSSVAKVHSENPSNSTAQDWLTATCNQCDGPSCDKSFLEKLSFEKSQNALLHLRTYSGDEDPGDVARNIAIKNNSLVQTVAGTFDLGCISDARQTTNQWLLDFKSLSGGPFADVTVFSSPAAFDGAVDASAGTGQQIAFFPRLDVTNASAFEARWNGDGPLSILAKYGASRTFNVEFRTDPQVEVNLVPGRETIVPGSIVLTEGNGTHAIIGTFSAGIQTVSQADLIVWVSPKVLYGVASEPIGYRVGVQNIGAVDAPATQLKLLLPTNVASASISGAGVSCTGESSITCDLGALPPAGEVDLDLSVTPANEGSLLVEASLSTTVSEVTLSNNSIALTLPVGRRVVGDCDHDGDVDKDDLQRVLDALNQPAKGDDPRDVDQDGKITALDARRLVTLCTQPQCAVR